MDLAGIAADLPVEGFAEAVVSRLHRRMDGIYQLIGNRLGSGQDLVGKTFLVDFPYLRRLEFLCDELHGQHDSVLLVEMECLEVMPRVRSVGRIPDPSIRRWMAL